MFLMVEGKYMGVFFVFMDEFMERFFYYKVRKGIFLDFLYL